jgi:hypothetical protein
MFDLVFTLRHGVLLTIKGEPSLLSITQFLGRVMDRFKSRTYGEPVGLYTDGPERGRLTHAEAVISNPGDAVGQYLPLQQWLEAVALAHLRAQALCLAEEEIDRYPPSGRGGPIERVNELLREPSEQSHLEALAIVMGNSWEEEAPFFSELALRQKVH